MKIKQRLFGEALVLEPDGRTDARGRMADFSPGEFREAVPGLALKMQRIYSMPERYTFFGIHYQEKPFPQAKLVSVLHGKALDYVVDLREGSATFGRWEAVELDAARPAAVYIPAGFGHGFLSLEPDTVQLFGADRLFVPGCAKSVSWKDPEIGLALPCDNPVLSEKDRNAPFLKDLRG